MQRTSTPVRTIKIGPTVFGCVLLIISIFYFIIGPDTSWSLISTLVESGQSSTVKYSYGETYERQWSNVSFVMNFLCTSIGLILLYRGGISSAISSQISNSSAVFMAFKTKAERTQRLRKILVIGLFVLAALLVLAGVKSWIGDGLPPVNYARLFLLFICVGIIGVNVDEQEAESFQEPFYDHNTATRVSIVQLLAGQFAYLADKRNGNYLLKHSESVVDASFSRAYIFSPYVFAPRYEMEVLVENSLGRLYYNVFRNRINHKLFPESVSQIQLTNLIQIALGPAALKKFIANVVESYEEMLEAKHLELVQIIRDYDRLEQNIFINQKLKQLNADNARLEQQNNFSAISRQFSKAVNEEIAHQCGVAGLIELAITIQLDESTQKKIEKIDNDLREAATKIVDINTTSQAEILKAKIRQAENPTTSKTSKLEMNDLGAAVTGYQVNSNEAFPDKNLGQNQSMQIESPLASISVDIIRAFMLEDSKSDSSHESKLNAIHAVAADFFFDNNININECYNELNERLEKVSSIKSEKVFSAVAEAVLEKYILHNG